MPLPWLLLNHPQSCPLTTHLSPVCLFAPPMPLQLSYSLSSSPLKKKTHKIDRNSFGLVFFVLLWILVFLPLFLSSFLSLFLFFFHFLFQQILLLITTITSFFFVSFTPFFCVLVLPIHLYFTSLCNPNGPFMPPSPISTTTIPSFKHNARTHTLYSPWLSLQQSQLHTDTLSFSSCFFAFVYHSLFDVFVLLSFALASPLFAHLIRIPFVTPLPLICS
ncbi:MAG: hypothetical protein JOS17DRAFT_561402 [Linnemannia elongata]|nr:MAG: hypothetical protein JOS17DRAFT_561402 [Linnemannia elongata]